MGIIFPVLQNYNVIIFRAITHWNTLLYSESEQFSLGVGSWPSNQATKGSYPKGTRLYFIILLKNVEKIFDWH